jgi:hypothetical protein
VTKKDKQFFELFSAIHFKKAKTDSCQEATRLNRFHLAPARHEDGQEQETIL